MVALLARTMVDRGVDLVFLMAAGEAEARIYARIGFTEIGEVLHISAPTPVEATSPGSAGRAGATPSP
jgi:hypothetical protein